MPPAGGRLHMSESLLPKQADTVRSPSAFPPHARLRAFYYDHLYRPLDMVRGRLEAIRASRMQSAALCFGLLAVLPFAVLMRPATIVSVDGVPIGAAANAATVQSVSASIAADLVQTSGRTDAFSPNLSFHTGFVLKDDIQDNDALRAALLDTADGVRDLAVIFVDDQPVAYCGSLADAQTAVDAVRIAYQDGDPDANAVFLEPVAVRTLAAPTDYAQQCGIAAATLTGVVDVRVDETVSYTEDIPYETVTRENVALPPDQTAVVQPGEAGQIAVSAQVVKINGKVQERTVVSRAVLSQPKKQIVEVGVKRDAFGVLTAPLESYVYTSGYQTTTRSRHAGIDLATEVGSAVMAADNGTVVLSEWSDSYGYYVIVDHGNGMQTLYAHNSQLIAHVGDYVAQGDLIALSGSTGNSTGPHVHFEVRINGSTVDPTFYVDFGTPVHAPSLDSIPITAEPQIPNATASTAASGTSDASVAAAEPSDTPETPAPSTADPAAPESGDSPASDDLDPGYPADPAESSFSQFPASDTADTHYTFW